MQTRRVTCAAWLIIGGAAMLGGLAGCDDTSAPRAGNAGGQVAVQGQELGAPIQPIDTAAPTVTGNKAPTDVAVAVNKDAPPVIVSDPDREAGPQPTAGTQAPPATPTVKKEQQPVRQFAATDVLPDIPKVPGYVSIPFEKLSGYIYATEFTTAPSLTASGFEIDDDKLAERVKLGDKQMPDDVRALDGKKVAIVGWMIPLDFEQGKTNEFILARTNGSCQFCQQQQINDKIMVTTVDNKRFDYNGDEPLLVTGVFSASIIIKDGFPTSLYRLVADGVRTVELK